MSDINAGAVAVDFEANLKPLKAAKTDFNKVIKEYADAAQVDVKLRFSKTTKEGRASIAQDIKALVTGIQREFDIELPIRLSKISRSSIQREVVALNKSLKDAMESDAKNRTSLKIPVEVSKASMANLGRQVAEAFDKAQKEAEKAGKKSAVKLDIEANPSHLLDSIRKTLKGEVFTVDLRGNIVGSAGTGNGPNTGPQAFASIEAANRRVTSMSRAEMLAELQKFSNGGGGGTGDGPQLAWRGRGLDSTDGVRLARERHHEIIARARVVTGVPQTSGPAYGPGEVYGPFQGSSYSNARLYAQMRGRQGISQGQIDRANSAQRYEYQMGAAEATASAARMSMTRPFAAGPLASNSYRFGDMEGGPGSAFQNIRGRMTRNTNYNTANAGMMEAQTNIHGAIESINLGSKRFYDRIQTSVRSMESEARRHFVAGMTLEGSITLPAVLAAGAIGRTATNYQNTLQKSSALAGIDEGDLPKASERILQLAKDPVISQNSQDLAESFYQIASSNLGPVAASLSLMETSAKGASAGLGSVRTVAEVLTSVVSVYGHSNKDAAKDLDILVSAVREGKGEASDFAPALGKVVAMGKIAGVGFNELAANIATVTRAGIPATAAATGLNMLLENIIDPSREASEALKMMGLSAEQLRESLATKGLLATLNMMMTAAHGNAAVVSKLVGSVTGLRNILTSAGAQAAAYEGILRRVTNSEGAADEAAEKMAKTMQRQFERVINTGQAFFTEIGMKVLPGIADATSNLADKTPAVLNGLVSAWEALPAPMSRALEVLAGFAVISGPFLKTKSIALNLGAGLLELAGSVAGNPLLTGTVGIATLYATMRGMEGVKSDVEQLTDAMTGNAHSWQEGIAGIVGWAAALGVAATQAAKLAPVVNGFARAGITGARGVIGGARTVSDQLSGGLTAANWMDFTLSRSMDRRNVVGGQGGFNAFSPIASRMVGGAEGTGGQMMMQGAPAAGAALAAVAIPTAIVAAATAYQLYVARTKEAEVEASNMAIANDALSKSFDRLTLFSMGNPNRVAKNQGFADRFADAGDDIGKLSALAGSLGKEKHDIEMNLKLSPSSRTAMSTEIDKIISQIEAKKISLDITPSDGSVEGFWDVVINGLQRNQNHQGNADAVKSGLWAGYEGMSNAFASAAVSPLLGGAYRGLTGLFTPTPAAPPLPGPQGSTITRLDQSPTDPKRMSIEAIKDEIHHYDGNKSGANRNSQLLERLNTWKAKNAPINPDATKTPGWVDEHRSRAEEAQLNREQAAWQAYVAMVEGASGKIRGYGEKTEEAKVRNEMFRLSVSGINDELKEQAINLAAINDRMEKMTGLQNMLRGVFEGAESKLVGMGALSDPGFLKAVQGNFNYSGRMNTLTSTGNAISGTLLSTAKGSMDSINSQRDKVSGNYVPTSAPAGTAAKPGGNPSSPNAPRSRLMPPQGGALPVFPGNPTFDANGRVSGIQGSGSLAPYDPSATADVSPGFQSRILASKPDFDGSLGNLQKVPTWLRKSWGAGVNENSPSSDTQKALQSALFGREGTKALIDEAKARGVGAVSAFVEGLRAAAAKYDAQIKSTANRLETQKMGRDNNAAIYALRNPSAMADLQYKGMTGELGAGDVAARARQRRGLWGAEADRGARDSGIASTRRLALSGYGARVLGQGEYGTANYERLMARAEESQKLWTDPSSPVFKKYASGSPLHASAMHKQMMAQYDLNYAGDATNQANFANGQSSSVRNRQLALLQIEGNSRNSGMGEGDISTKMAGEAAKRATYDIYAKTPWLQKVKGEQARVDAEAISIAERLVSAEKQLNDARTESQENINRSGALNDFYKGQGYNPASQSWQSDRARTEFESQAQGMFKDSPMPKSQRSAWVQQKMEEWLADQIEGATAQDAQQGYEQSGRRASLGDTTGLVDTIRNVFENAFSPNNKGKVTGLIDQYRTESIYGLQNTAAMSRFTNEGDRTAYNNRQSIAAYQRSFPGQDTSHLTDSLNQVEGAARQSEAYQAASEMIKSRKDSLAAAVQENEVLKATSDEQRMRLGFEEDLNALKRNGIILSKEDEATIRATNEQIISQKRLAEAKSDVQAFASTVRDSFQDAFKSAANNGDNFFATLGKHAKDLAEDTAFKYLSTKITQQIVPGAAFEDERNPYGSMARLKKQKGLLPPTAPGTPQFGPPMLSAIGGYAGGTAGELLGALAPYAGTSPMSPGAIGGLGQIVAQQVAMTASIVTITAASVQVNGGGQATGLGALSSLFGGSSSGGKSASQSVGQAVGPITAAVRSNRGLFRD